MITVLQRFFGYKKSPKRRRSMLSYCKYYKSGCTWKASGRDSGSNFYMRIALEITKKFEGQALDAPPGLVPYTIQ
jgi:hypothetical protein